MADDRKVEMYSTKGVSGRRDDSIPGVRERVTGTQLKAKEHGIELNSDVCGGDIFDVVGPKLRGYCELDSVGDGTVRAGHPNKRYEGVFKGGELQVTQSYTRDGHASVANAQLKYGPEANQQTVDAIRRAITSSKLERF